MKKFLCLGLGLCLLFALAGCSGARSYTVTFKNGESVVKTLEAKAGEQLDLRYCVKAPEKEADESYIYTFSGWTLEEGGEAVIHHTVRGNAVFYAQFQAEKREPQPPAPPEKREFTLYLHVLEETEEQKIVEGDALPLAAPELPALIAFEAWCTDEERTQETELEEMPSRDLHLYAKCGLDLPQGSLVQEGGFVYGEQNTVRVSGLTQAEGLSYAYTWQGAEGEGDSVTLTEAGEHALSVEIVASYRGLSATQTLSQTFSVRKRALQAFVSGQSSYVYGETVSPALHCEGLVHGDSANSLGARFVFAKNGVPVPQNSRLPAGDYTVTAEFPPLKNYELAPISPASFTMTKRPVSAVVTVSDITYGEEPSPQIAWSGILEDESAPSAGEAYVYLKGGEPHTGRFTPGSYTLEVNANAISMENYSLGEVNSCTFTVKKAPLTGTISLQKESVVYGEAPAPALVAEGFVYGESADLAPVFRYLGEKQGDPLPAGEYEVTAELRVPEYYTLASLRTAHLTVEKRTLTPVVAVQTEFTYGETPAPTLEFSGFAAGEGKPQLTISGSGIVYTRNGAPHEGNRFPAGNYTAAADLAALSAENYTFAEGNRAEFSVKKAQGTLDVSGVQREYTYTGSLQTVSGGATTNNSEDGVITYTNNTFTTVAEGEALIVTVTLSEGENYMGATATADGFTVHKQTLTRLPVEAPVLSEQVNKIGKTLADISISDPRFTWKSGGEPLVLGRHGYEAVYDGDPDNVFPFETSLSFSTRKEVFDLSVMGGEGDYEANAAVSGLTLASYTLTDEAGLPCGETVKTYVKFTPTATLTLSVGGTYPVQWTFVLTENDYFKVRYSEETTGETLHEFSGKAPFKWKSVELGGALYTAEDALAALLPQQTATVKYDTSFCAEDFYRGDEFYTVKSGAALLVPFGEEDTGVTEQLTPNRSYEAVAPEGYLTLSLPKGTLAVEGKLIVNADRVSNSNQTSNVRGGAYATLNIGKDAQVVVKHGGVFESMGFTCGEGSVKAEDGATVYEPFAMPGWKGGTVSTGIRGTVFPVNQFTASSLIAKTELEAGATYSLRVAVTASSSAQNGLINFVGKENALMLLQTGKITKYVDEMRGRVHFDIAGEVTFGNVSIAVSVGSASTAGLQVPLPGHFCLALKEGSVTVPDTVGLKLLPGAEFTSEAGTSFTVKGGGALYAYGQENHTFTEVSAFQDGNLGGLKAYPNGYVSGCYRKSPALGYTASTPARVNIGGTFTAEEGARIGVKFTGKEGARLSLAEGGHYENTVKEDFSTTNDIGGFMNSLLGTGGKFFQTSFTCADLSAGNYTFTDGNWSREE